MAFSHLFSAGKIGTCDLRNRIIMALFPTKYSTDSMVNSKMMAFYRARARGGAALIVLDCPCLDYPRAYKGPQELRFDEEPYAGSVRELLAMIHDEGAKAFMQLNYPGERVVPHQVRGARKKGENWIVALANGMSLDEAVEITDIMAQGAKRARAVGYDGVEIQASYGDLIAELLSPLLNKRVDGLGGSLENRARFLTGLIGQVKAAAGSDFPVMIKLVCDEFVPGGLGVAEAAELARLAEKAGADAIVANAGNKATKHITIPSHESPPGPLVPIAARVKKAVGIPVVAIGKINSPGLAEEVIREGKADFVAMARNLVADPDFPRKAASGKTEDIRGCVYCLEDCPDKGVPGVGRCCIVNPFVGREHEWVVRPAAGKKRVLVIGGGPSGIQAALIAAQRGHETTLWESKDQLGGQVRLASLAPFKEEMSEVLRYLLHTLEKSNVKVELSRHAEVSEVIAFGADAVIVATGSRAGWLSLAGCDQDFVTDARKAYEGACTLGDKVAIIGGGLTGCETADWLAGPDRQVTVVEMLPDVMGTTKKLPRERLLSRLAEKGVRILTETKATGVERDKVRLKKKGGEEMVLEADTVIFAVDPRPEDKLAESLKGKVQGVFVVGDAAAPGNIGSALRTATEVSLGI